MQMKSERIWINVIGIISLILFILFSILGIVISIEDLGFINMGWGYFLPEMSRIFILLMLIILIFIRLIIWLTLIKNKSILLEYLLIPFITMVRYDFNLIEIQKSERKNILSIISASLLAIIYLLFILRFFMFFPGSIVNGLYEVEQIIFGKILWIAFFINIILLTTNLILEIIQRKKD